MTTFDSSTLNAKRMSMEAVVRSFVVPETFEQLCTSDHAFLIGPRGSGKTTLLKMLSSRYLHAWDAADRATARSILKQVHFTGVFLPTDSLWTTQTHPDSRVLAFACQLLNSLVDAMLFKIAETSRGATAHHFSAVLSNSDEVALVKELSSNWRLDVDGLTLRSLSQGLDRLLLQSSVGRTESPISADPFLMAAQAVRLFNRYVGQDGEPWCILMDELEIAPDEVLQRVMNVVRGGGPELIIKASMSPSDHSRADSVRSEIGRPMPGHDFVPVHLLQQSPAAKRSFAQVLWHQALLEEGIEPVSLEESFGRSFQASARDEGVVNPLRDEFELALSWDKAFAAWFRERQLDLDRLDDLDYVRRSATVRKVYPILVYRNGVYKKSYNPRGWDRRSRKKEFEAFAGAPQVINALEGNPRWIKSAFRAMASRASTVSGQVDAPMQYSALLDVARSFESFLRFVPSPDVSGRVVNNVSLIFFVNAVARVMHDAHNGRFTADPPNSFLVDEATARRFGEVIDLGLHAGGLVHLRDRSSSPILSDYVGQRFRLTYLLAVRPELSFPMRLGRAVTLGRQLAADDMLRGSLGDVAQMQLPLEGT